jgi:hypothetical protein
MTLLYMYACMKPIMVIDLRLSEAFLGPLSVIITMPGVLLCILTSDGLYLSQGFFRMLVVVIVAVAEFRRRTVLIDFVGTSFLPLSRIWTTLS